MRTEMLSFGLSIVRGPNRYPVMQFYDELHRPDLVAELLKGDPQGKYRDAAGRLESILDLRLPR
jgi:hypothetical protein